MYPISANLVQRDLRNSTIEGEKIPTSITFPDSAYRPSLIHWRGGVQFSIIELLTPEMNPAHHFPLCANPGWAFPSLLAYACLTCSLTRNRRPVKSVKGTLARVPRRDSGLNLIIAQLFSQSGFEIEVCIFFSAIYGWIWLKFEGQFTKPSVRSLTKFQTNRSADYMYRENLRPNEL